MIHGGHRTVNRCGRSGEAHIDERVVIVAVVGRVLEVRCLEHPSAEALDLLPRAAERSPGC